MNSIRIVAKRLWFLSINVVVVLQLALLPVAWAAGSAPETKTPPAKATARKLTPEEEKAFNRALLDHYVREYHAAGSPKRLVKNFFSRLKESDRKELAPLVEKLEKLPRLERVDDTLVFTGDGVSYVVEWPRVTDPKFKFKGVGFEYNPKKPLKEQIGLLVRKIELTGKNVWLDLAFPKAEADGGLTLAAVAVIVVTTIITNLVANALAPTFAGVGKSLNGWICRAGRWFGAKSEDWALCADWAKAEKDKATKRGPKLDAIEKLIGTDSGNVAAKWDVRERECPKTFDGKTDLVYAADMAGVECQADRKARQQDSNTCFFGVRAVLSPKGVPKAMLVTPPGVDATKIDLTKPEDVKKIIANFKFNEDKEMTGIQVPNPEYNSADPLSKPLLDLTWDNNVKLAPSEQAYLSASEDMLNFTNSRLTKCSIENVKEQLDQGVDPGSPGTAAPGAVAPTGTTSAPAIK